MLENAGEMDAAGQIAHLALEGFPGDAVGFVDGSDDEVLQHFDVSALDSLGVDGERLELLLAGTTALTMPPPLAAS